MVDSAIPSQTPLQEVVMVLHAKRDALMGEIVKINNAIEVLEQFGGDSTLYVTMTPPVVQHAAKQQRQHKMTIKPARPKPEFFASKSSGDWRKIMHGLTQRQALDRIADLNDGIVRTIDAKEIFLAAGLSKGLNKNINGHIHHLLTIAENYEKIAPGTFRRINQNANAIESRDSQAEIPEITNKPLDFSDPLKHNSQYEQTEH